MFFNFPRRAGHEIEAAIRGFSEVSLKKKL